VTDPQPPCRKVSACQRPDATISANSTGLHQALLTAKSRAAVPSRLLISRRAPQPPCHRSFRPLRGRAGVERRMRVECDSQLNGLVFQAGLANFSSVRPAPSTSRIPIAVRYCFPVPRTRPLRGRSPTAGPRCPAEQMPFPTICSIRGRARTLTRSPHGRSVFATTPRPARLGARRT
jgi:hypothetical protein